LTRGRQALIGRVQGGRDPSDQRSAAGERFTSQSAQNAIDVRYNPFTVLTLDQLSPRVPIAPAGGALRLRAKEIRPEISPGLLRLKIVYEFVSRAVEFAGKSQTDFPYIISHFPFPIKLTMQTLNKRVTSDK